MNTKTLLSHSTQSKIAYSDMEDLIEVTRNRLKSSKQLTLSLEETLSLLNELVQFEFGRFLLKNKGLNGYWTAYIFRHKPENPIKNSLESWLLNNSLLVLARERFYIFQREIQKRLQSHTHFASIPCGLMDDLLQLDYKNLQNVQLTGIDLDKESLQLAKENAIEKGLYGFTHFIQQDAWTLAVSDEFDLISSNGLNMYEPEENRLLQLYAGFYKALKTRGTLVISFLPPPSSSDTDLNLASQQLGIPLDDFKKELAIFKDIAQVNYFNFCTEEKIKNQLEKVGFKVQDILYTRRKGVAPVLIASKP